MHEIIKTQRKKLALSQIQLAKECNIIRQTIAEIESGKDCKLSTFKSICNALGLTIEIK
jgi:DNA-binding XRE family transcriptional regulator